MASIELKFLGTFSNSDYLKEFWPTAKYWIYFYCGFCQQYLTELDISQGNYRLYVSDYANEVSKDKFLILADKISLYIFLRAVRTLPNLLWINFLIKSRRTPRVSGGGGVISPPFLFLH
ncbi:MAG: hypothetical protein I3273_06820 [Candidatus Moeniiplasma glomeromycotorum]|nr:hypothetical protein [Candidatus Moeniiplasma glomeromycotorum]MCE8168153.1 hypothetical protein [Candidatus Moeniiplasma glomeromycotorum]MCE8169798.1 hypothetical protein [Candidatus Moeniiplasma glomeromycotorum]